MKYQLLIMALGLLTSNAIAQTSASFVTIPPNQYGQQSNFNNCDTSGRDLTRSQIEFVTTERPDTFSLFIVENVRNYPSVTKTQDTLIMVKDSNLGYHYRIGNVVYQYNSVGTSLIGGNPTFYIMYTLPPFSSYQQWRNSFVQVHFKVKGDDSLYTVKDTTVRLGFVLQPNLTVHGLLLSSDNYVNIMWYKNYPGGTPLYTGIPTIPLLNDGDYCAFETSENYYFGSYRWACTTQTCITFKAIKDSTGGGKLQVPFISGATYQWSYQGTPISNATSNTYQATASGTYSVSVIFDFTQAAANFRIDGSNIVTGNYSFDYTATVTEIENDILNPKDKILVRVYNPLGQTVKPEEANEGMFIYQYSDGSTRKVMKSGK